MAPRNVCALEIAAATNKTQSIRAFISLSSAEFLSEYIIGFAAERWSLRAEVDQSVALSAFRYFSNADRPEAESRQIVCGILPRYVFVISTYPASSSFAR